MLRKAASALRFTALTKSYGVTLAPYHVTSRTGPPNKPQRR